MTKEHERWLLIALAVFALFYLLPKLKATPAAAAAAPSTGAYDSGD